MAIDCEMGTSKQGESELIRATLLDYFTGERLVDNLVFPDVSMEHYNTRFSGVTLSMMETARDARTCFFGRDSAREAIWQYVGPATIVVGHSAVNDLKSLRWIHRCIIDTFLLEPVPEPEKPDPDEERNYPSRYGKGKARQSSAEDLIDLEQRNLKGVGNLSLAGRPSGFRMDSASPRASEGSTRNPRKPKGTGPRALKTLASVKLGRTIQDAGKRGHDSFEDALAARDLVHWTVLDRRRSATLDKAWRDSGRSRRRT